MLRDRIRNQGYWPEQLKHPSEYRRFFVAEDLTFCGFALNMAEVALEKQAQKNKQLNE